MYSRSMEKYGKYIIYTITVQRRMDQWICHSVARTNRPSIWFFQCLTPGFNQLTKSVTSDSIQWPSRLGCVNHPHQCGRSRPNRLTWKEPTKDMRVSKTSSLTASFSPGSWFLFAPGNTEKEGTMWNLRQRNTKSKKEIGNWEDEAGWKSIVFCFQWEEVLFEVCSRLLQKP